MGRNRRSEPIRSIPVDGPVTDPYYTNNRKPSMLETIRLAGVYNNNNIYALWR